MLKTVIQSLLTCSLVTSVAFAEDRLLFDFESPEFAAWTVAGKAFGTSPAQGALPGQMAVSGFEGQRLANSFVDGDRTTGALTSEEFELTHDYLSFLIGGGNQPADLGVELLVDGKRRRDASGQDSEELAWTNWDVREFKGQKARVRIFDRATGGWGHVLVDQITLGDAPRISEQVRRIETYRKSPNYYREKYRPQFHFTPEMNWTNDPNGMVYFDGEYHLFYQHNPHGNEWGHMSWGHAVSEDLVRWQHLPIALQEEYGVMIFSGSAVVDHKNTSGFGADGMSPLVAIYTGHQPDRQTQDIAYSNDRGRTWTKYEHNPVIDIGERDFRDPKVFWHAPTSQWIMVVALAAQKRVQFYGSHNLKEWSHLSDFGPAGVKDKPNWECPDLFELPLVNEPGQSRWVLETNIGGGAPAGGSGSEYFIGAFDGREFKSESLDSQWVDYGRDFYATASWSDIPISDGRRIWLGWMNNWETALVPTYPWRGAMSVPRDVTLRRVDGKLRLCQTPVRELQSLRADSAKLAELSLNDESKPLNLRGEQVEIVVEFELGTATEFGLHVRTGTNQNTIVGYDTAKKALFVDRTQAGESKFHSAFAGRHSGSLTPDANRRVRLHVLVDSCSVEVFGNDGETVITDLIFPEPASDGVALYAQGGDCKVIACQAWKLKSAWRKPNEPGQ